MANSTGTVTAKPEPEWQDYKPDEQGWQDYAPAPTQREGALPAGSYQTRRRGPILNANVSPLRTGVMAAERSLGINQPLQGASFREDMMNALGQTGSSLWKFAKEAPRHIGDPLGLAGYAAEPIATGLEEGSKDITVGLERHDPRSLAHGIGEVGPYVSPGLEDITKEGIARAGRRPTGELRRGVRPAVGIVGGLAGHEAIPYAGGYLGYKAGHELAEGLIPQRSDVKAARAAAKAADLKSASSAKPSPATKTLRGEMQMPRAGTTSSAPGGQGVFTREQPKQTAPTTPTPPITPAGVSKPRMTAAEVRAQGISAEGRARGTLSPYMQRKVENAQTMHATRKSLRQQMLAEEAENEE